MRSTTTKLLIIFISVLCVPFVVRAQTVSIETNPQYPSFGDTVLFTAVPFGFNIQDKIITWKKNGEIISSGYGATFYSDIISNSEENYKLSVEVLNGDKKVTSIYTISPFTVDLLWEVPDGYTPPFYKGKTLPVRQSNVIFNAIPSGKHPSDVSFNWSKGSEARSTQSGLGKNTFSNINDLLYIQDTVSVVAQDSNGQKAFNQSTVSYRSPEAVFYKTDPVLGVEWNNAVTKNESFKDKTLTLTVIPYYMTISNIQDSIFSLSWLLNKAKVNQTDSKNQISIQNNGEDVVVSTVFDHTNRLYQDAQIDLNFNFSK